MTVKILEEKYYSSRPNFKDGTTEFHEILDSLITHKNFSILEIGAGPENKTSSFISTQVARLDGLDIDERARTNPALNNIIIYDGSIFPIEDESYDLVVADYVMEHVEHPELMISEIHRILHKGGHFIFRTPNIFHYVSIISRFTPHWFHLLVANKARKNSESAVDPYPTFYRFNSRRAVRAIISKVPMREVQLRMVEKQPSYMMFNTVAYRLGVLYERVVNFTQVLAPLRSNIFGILVKE